MRNRTPIRLKLTMQHEQNTFKSCVSPIKTDDDKQNDCAECSHKTKSRSNDNIDDTNKLKGCVSPNKATTHCNDEIANQKSPRKRESMSDDSFDELKQKLNERRLRVRQTVDGFHNFRAVKAADQACNSRKDGSRRGGKQKPKENRVNISNCTTHKLSVNLDQELKPCILKFVGIFSKVST